MGYPTRLNREGRFNLKKVCDLELRDVVWELLPVYGDLGEGVVVPAVAVKVGKIAGLSYSTKDKDGTYTISMSGLNGQTYELDGYEEVLVEENR